MKFTKRSAANAALGAAFIAAVLVGIHVSSFAEEAKWTLLEEPEGYDGYVVEGVWESPDGRWELVLATDKSVDPAESVFLIVDPAAEVIRKEVRAGKKDDGTRLDLRNHAWTPDGSRAVLVEFPLPPPYPDWPAGDDVTEEEQHEWLAKTLELDRLEIDLMYQPRLILIDVDSGTRQTVGLEPGGRIVALSSCAEGNIHAGVHVQESGERTIKAAIHEIAPSGEYVGRWDIPELADPYTLGAFRLDAKSRTVWANIGTKQDSPLAVAQHKYLGCAPYGEGAEEAEWEHVLEDARLLDVDPTGAAILFEIRQTRPFAYELYVMHVATGDITEVVAVTHEAVPRIVHLPQSKSLTRGGQAVRLAGDGGLPELQGEEADPDLYGQRVLWEYTLPGAE